MFAPARLARFACIAVLATAPLAAAAAPGDQAGDLAAFVHGTLAAAPTNFSSVRGKRIDTAKFAALVDFGPTFVQCTVDDDTAAALENGGISAWSLGCDSQPVAIPAAGLLAQLKDELSASIPASFVLTTFADDTGQAHLHWKGPNGVAIDATAWQAQNESNSHFRVTAIHLIGGALPQSEATPLPRS